MTMDVVSPSSPPPPSLYDAEKKFIQAYEKLPMLWDSKHDHYHNKYKRKEALQKLLQIYRLIKPAANIYDVRMKINGLRTYYRKELKKVNISKLSVSSPFDVYVPKSWTFDLLYFLEEEVQASLSQDTHDCNNSEQIQDIDHEENETELSSAIYISPKKRARDIIIRSNKKKPKIKKNNKADETQSGVPHMFKVKNPIAFIWADKLENLQPKQRLFAEKAINDVLFEAELENLNRFSVKINASSNPNSSSYTECYVSTNIVSPTSNNRNHQSSVSSSDDGDNDETVMKCEVLDTSD
ncbi:uncharacterized protein LOC131844302 [Achroia grisella]|uniref:uncharacterized protein LOC131844302 n=1 Tax=Achroia grisella TaxID=688607 RepID=UPI0027D2F2EE|nr:uncharacterized protein LOC131844302 [Achroia grisella]